jgi:hypothetical protein
MPDLRHRFALADQLEAPNVWARAIAKSELIEQLEPAAASETDATRHRVAAAFVAFAVFAAAALFAWQVFSERTAPPPVDAPLSDPWASLSPGLNELPPPPSARTGAAIVWTGRMLVVWGGSHGMDGEVQFDDGFGFDPVAGRWTSLPPSPLRARSFPVAVWSGREALIWGGWREPTGELYDDGAAFDPAVGGWRLLPEAPIPYGRRSVAAWTGSEMVVWNSEEGTGAAYSPATDTWRSIVDAPFPLERVGKAVWTGTQMVGLGLSRSGGHNEIRARGLSYDPSADVWTELPRPDLSEDARDIVWTGSEIIGIDYYNRVQSYRPGDDRWTDLPDIPAEAAAQGPQAAYSSGDLLVGSGGQVVMTIETRAWGDLLPLTQPSQGSLYPIAAGRAIVLLQSAPERNQPAPSRFVVWRP